MELESDDDWNPDPTKSIMDKLKVNFSGTFCK
jgi:hypothetical protein